MKVDLTIIPATPGNWSIYRDGDALIKRPVIAWGLGYNDTGMFAACLHPGTTAFAVEAAAVIDPSGVVTVCATGKTFTSYRLFLAWLKAGGVLE